MEKRRNYPTDLSDAEWKHLKILLPRASGRGRRRSAHQQRELLNAMIYEVKTGCQWRMLPHDFPPWQTVYAYFDALKQAGVWQNLNDRLRQGVRQEAGRDPEPSVVIVDSQSVKTTEKKGACWGYDGGKRVKGRKRHLAVDVMGWLLGVKVFRADYSDDWGGKHLLKSIPFAPRWAMFIFDGGYDKSPFLNWCQQLVDV